MNSPACAICSAGPPRRESRDGRLQEFARGIAVQLGDRTLVLGATLDGTRGWSRR
ncbi:MAG: hypothetical protein R2854_13270 [Caldilineaceae bacterium]